MYLGHDAAGLGDDVKCGALSFACFTAFFILEYHNTASFAGRDFGVIPTQPSAADAKKVIKLALIGAFLGGAAGDESVNYMTPISEIYNNSTELAGDLPDEA